MRAPTDGNPLSAARRKGGCYFNGALYPKRCSEGGAPYNEDSTTAFIW